MPIGLTPQRRWLSINGPAPGNAVTSSLFINNWITSLMDRTEYLKGETHSIGSASIVDGSGETLIQNVDSRVLHLTADAADATQAETKIYFSNKSSDAHEAARRMVVVDKLSKGSLIRFSNHTPSQFYSYTAQQNEYGLVFEFGHTATSFTWELLYKNRDSLRGTPCDIYENATESPSITGSGARNLAIIGDPITGTGTIELTDPTDLDVLYNIHVKQIAAGATLAISSPASGTFYTYLAKRSTDKIRITLLITASGWEVVSVGSEERALNMQTLAGPTTSPIVISSAYDYIRINTPISLDPTVYRLSNGSYEGQEFTLYVDRKTSTGPLALANAGNVIFSQTSEAGYGLTIKAKWIGGDWRANGISVGQ